jgi:HTH-type transcriptional regulator/antitoxin HipB
VVDYPIKTLNQLRPILLGFRKAAGLTQAMMASHLGVTQQTYAELEADPAAVSVERLFRVLRVLDVDLTLAHTSRVTPPPGKKKSTPGTPLRATSVPKRTNTARKGGSGNEPEVRRSARKTGGIRKKRENW